MLKVFIIFLIRKKLGLKKNEAFIFEGQKSNAYYFFTETAVMKNFKGHIQQSNVSLNWLLDDCCKIQKIEE